MQEPTTAAEEGDAHADDGGPAAVAADGAVFAVGDADGVAGGPVGKRGWPMLNPAVVPSAHASRSARRAKRKSAALASCSLA